MSSRYSEHELRPAKVVLWHASEDLADLFSVSRSAGRNRLLLLALAGRAFVAANMVDVDGPVQDEGESWVGPGPDETILPAPPEVWRNRFAHGLETLDERASFVDWYSTAVLRGLGISTNAAEKAVAIALKKRQDAARAQGTDVDKPKPELITHAAIDEFYRSIGQWSSARWWGEFTAPPAVASLVAAMVSIGEGTQALDLTLGAGRLLWQLASVEAGGSPALSGFDLDGDSVGLASYILALSGLSVRASIGDALNVPGGTTAPLSGFDLVVVDPPWGMRTGATRRIRAGAAQVPSELGFIHAGMEYVREGAGELVAVVPVGVLSRASRGAVEMRRALSSQRGLSIAKVVLMRPVHINTGIQCCVVVFRPSAMAPMVRFVDASDPLNYSATRDLSRTGIDRILASLDAAEGIPGVAASVSLDDVLSGDCSWDPRHYIEPIVDELLAPEEALAELRHTSDDAGEARSALEQAILALEPRRARKTREDK